MSRSALHSTNISQGLYFSSAVLSGLVQCGLWNVSLVSSSSRKVLQHWIFTQRPVFQVCFHSRPVPIWEFHFPPRT